MVFNCVVEKWLDFSGKHTFFQMSKLFWLGVVCEHVYMKLYSHLSRDQHGYYTLYERKYLIVICNLGEAKTVCINLFYIPQQLASDCSCIDWEFVSNLSFSFLCVCLLQHISELRFDGFSLRFPVHQILETSFLQGPHIYTDHRLHSEVSSEFTTIPQNPNFHKLYLLSLTQIFKVNLAGKNWNLYCTVLMLLWSSFNQTKWLICFTLLF